MKGATKTPTADQVRAARIRAKLTQEQAGRLIYVHRQTWNRYESGEIDMPAASWELWKMKTTARTAAQSEPSK
jgi:DNA-binding XRE family transcriptional regulator